ncbi:hypothetical protein DPMN_056444 [Dreissena polymorpha]|uniref:Sushi domain-containing protein n=1 Tax=Dreissena polymorpha TaxID=45954 RepID=A0A9D4CT96_DREPO|nr:hypothetical protein DPMN_056444 [Dreissena polymorpha]
MYTSNYRPATTNGEVAVVRCNSGFKPRGSLTSKCEASGHWNLTQVLKCALIDCDDPTPARGRVNTSSTVFNTVVNVSCEEGYKLSGSHVIICQEDGTWSGKAICDPSDCDCHRFYLANGSVAGNKTTYGASLELRCDTGYTLLGGNRLTCQDHGKWSENSTCVIKDCGNFTEPTHGRILNIPIVTTFKSVIHFACDDGYLLQGHDSAQCDSTGLWTSARPICIKKCNLV